ncbi:hypothetical protein DFH27DRAFT_610688 [Peziza echinospora]|nr:hypothetical protein DFH27DRAFT_610688 [Peziza echinospora]
MPDTINIARNRMSTQPPDEIIVEADPSDIRSSLLNKLLVDNDINPASMDDKLHVQILNALTASSQGIDAEAAPPVPDGAE